MKIFLYAMAALLVIIWAVAFLMLNAGGMVHFIIVLALALVMINKANEKRVQTRSGPNLNEILLRNNLIQRKRQ